MISGGSEIPAFKILQDDKFFNRLMSKESSLSSSSTASPSFRVYYGGATGSVPFKWESQPGTPKHALVESSLPPLTPPPSYHFSKQTQQPTKKLSARSKLFNLIMFLRFRSGCKVKNAMKSSSLSSSFSLPSSPSVSSGRSSSSLSSIFLINHDYQSKYQKTKRRSRFSSFDSYGTTDFASTDSPTSTLCLGTGMTKSTVGKCYIW